MYMDYLFVMNVQRVLSQVGIKMVVAMRPEKYNIAWEESINNARNLSDEAEVMYLIDRRRMRFECGPEWDMRIININPKPLIGIVMSGGIDSWVLYNILKLSFKMPKIVVFNIKRDDGFDNAETVKRLTGTTEIIEIDEWTTEHHNRVPLGIEYILENYGIDELYSGVNIIPHTEYFPEFITDAKPGRPWSML